MCACPQRAPELVANLLQSALELVAGFPQKSLRIGGYFVGQPRLLCVSVCVCVCVCEYVSVYVCVCGT